MSLSNFRAIQVQITAYPEDLKLMADLGSRLRMSRSQLLRFAVAKLALVEGVPYLGRAPLALAPGRNGQQGG